MYIVHVSTCTYLYTMYSIGRNQLYIMLRDSIDVYHTLTQTTAVSKQESASFT